MPGANNAFIVSLLLFLLSIFLLFFIPLNIKIKQNNGYAYRSAIFAKIMLWVFSVLSLVLNLLFIAYSTNINPLFFLPVSIFVLALVIWRYRKKRAD